ncbi:NTP transferase domain-containing protein [Leucobacter viscericola]|uniref:NTP transferase domain-containing protein n=1 Tax=Leucobacter viscericola TaxID=2714935 RepID=A0A6G7XD24_9MICO|nr:NTP transferase domain-containing protein [Leucobacter viscericola]QIK62494.1 NTP transferase domain-containing protein [Leucobacter viscericola]
MNRLAFDAVVLAGGRGSRLGGVDKATLTLGGERLVDRAVAAVRAAGAEHVVVVGPDHAGGDGVIVVREDPPFAGPLAALAAALPALHSEWVLLLSCDLVRPDRVCEALVGTTAPVILRELANRRISPEETDTGLQSTGSFDGCALRDSEGRPQWLAGLYRVTSLRTGAQRLGTDLENAPLRRLLGTLDLHWIDALPEVTADIDNPDDLERARTLNAQRRTP